MRVRNYIGRLALISAALLGAATMFDRAHAHFILVTPDSWMSQGPLGDPQKLGPCGDEGGGTPTGKVTEFRPGDTVEITIDEKVPHPGHYRVALAVNDRSELPPPPPVTAVDRDPCGSVAIQDPPVFPVLADNMLPHTEPFDGPQTFTVTLPSDITCTRCTLQVIEYMSRHGQPCFYHHCADIAIQAASGTTPTPTATPVAAATATPTPPAVCEGDCDTSGRVAVDEIVTLVSIALGRAPIADCQAGNLDGNQQITINELMAAVNSSLAGCSAESTHGHARH